VTRALEGEGGPGRSAVFTPAGDPALFRCACARPACDAPPPSTDLLARLNLLRHRLGRPLVVTSGPRCRWYNAQPEVGGEATSDHLWGEGVDLRVSTSGERDEVLAALYQPPRLFLRVGVGPDFVHAGLPGPERPGQRCWVYYERIKRAAA
jgi:hypothetical protein